MAAVYKIVYLPLAEDDILASVEYIAGKLGNPQAAESLLDELDKTAEQLALFPYASELYYTDRPMRDELRKVRVKGYVLYYTVRDDTVEIRRLIHGRRDRSWIEY